MSDSSVIAITFQGENCVKICLMKSDHRVLN
jgi:hypothetical protein